MKDKHTPAPWVINERLSCKFWKKITGGNDIIADVKMHVTRGLEEQGQANAKLIATAPDLLEACKIAVEVIHDLTDYGIEGNDVNYAEFIEKAIKKATS